MSADARMVKLAELWERTSAKGGRYFSGFMGGCQVLMFDGGEQPHPTRPGETVHVWRLMVQERDPARRPSEARGDPAAKGSASPEARQERGSGWRGPSAYRQPSGAQRGREAAGGSFYEDRLDDIGRSR